MGHLSYPYNNRPLKLIKTTLRFLFNILIEEPKDNIFKISIYKQPRKALMILLHKIREFSNISLFCFTLI